MLPQERAAPSQKKKKCGFAGLGICDDLNSDAAGVMSGSDNSCHCKATWTSTQAGCEGTHHGCIQACGPRLGPWCAVENPGCATQAAIEFGSDPWSSCQHPHKEQHTQGGISDFTARAPAMAKQTPADVPAQTTMQGDHPPGSTELQVVDTSNFQVGQKIAIDSKSPMEEQNEVVSVGSSIGLKHPTQFAHGAGAAVDEQVDEPAGTSTLKPSMFQESHKSSHKSPTSGMLPKLSGAVEVGNQKVSSVMAGIGGEPGPSTTVVTTPPTTQPASAPPMATTPVIAAAMPAAVTPASPNMAAAAPAAPPNAGIPAAPQSASMLAKAAPGAPGASPHAGPVAQPAGSNVGGSSSGSGSSGSNKVTVGVILLMIGCCIILGIAAAWLLSRPTKKTKRGTDREAYLKHDFIERQPMYSDGVAEQVSSRQGEMEPMIAQPMTQSNLETSGVRAMPPPPPPKEVEPFSERNVAPNPVNAFMPGQAIAAPTMAPVAMPPQTLQYQQVVPNAAQLPGMQLGGSMQMPMAGSMFTGSMYNAYR